MEQEIQQIAFTLVHTSTNKHYFERAAKGEEILYYSKESVVVGPLKGEDFNNGYYVPPEKVWSLYFMLEKNIEPDKIIERLELEKKPWGVVCRKLEERLNSHSDEYASSQRRRCWGKEEDVPRERYVEVEIPPMFQGGGIHPGTPDFVERTERATRITRESDLRGQVGINPIYDPNSPNRPLPWPCTKEDMEF